MTIEQAIGMSADELSAMTDEDLKKHFDQYLIVTRPENAPKSMKQEQQILIANPEFERARALAKSIGIEMPVFKSMKRKGR